MAAKKNIIINEYHLNRNQPDQPQFVIYDLNDYLKKDRTNTTKPHIHSFYQIIWFKSGRGKHFVDFKAYNVFDQVIFFVAKNQVHYFDQNTRYKGILIHFNETFLAQKDHGTASFLKFNLFNDPYQQPFCSIGKDIDDILNENILQIKRELKNDNEYGKQELLRYYLKSFLIHIQRKKIETGKYRDNIAPALDEKRGQLIKFMNLIEEHYKEGLSISEYARLLLVSSRTLSDLTNQLLNKTPSQMIQERLVLEAKCLLLHSNLNINQVANHLGFDDPSYFVKYFRKHTNVSPSGFRKSVS